MIDEEFFPYRFAGWAVPALRPLGVRPDRDGVWVDRDHLWATYGHLDLCVPLARVSGARSTASIRPSWNQPGRLGFVTGGAGGVLVTFDGPVGPVVGRWTHHELVVTVDEPERLVARIT